MHGCRSVYCGRTGSTLISRVCVGCRKPDAAMPQPSPMDDLAHAIATLAASGAPEDPRVGEGLDRWRRSRSATLEEAAGWASNVRATSMQRARDEARSGG